MNRFGNLPISVKFSIVLSIPTVALLVYMMVFKHSSEVGRDLVPGRLLDIGWSWDEAQVRSLFEAIGEEGRVGYRRHYDEFLGDMLLPVLYSTCMASLIFYMHPKRRWRCIYPLASGTFDFVENKSIKTLLDNWPYLDK